MQDPIYNPLKDYQLPKKEEIQEINDFLSKNKYYKYGISHNRILLRKTLLEPLIDFTIFTNRLKYVLNKDKVFEYDCDQIMNMAKYTIHKSIVTKNDTIYRPFEFVQIPITNINKCSKYDDFVKSLENIGTKVTIVNMDGKNEKTGILLYHLKTNRLNILDDFKPY